MKKTVTTNGHERGEFIDSIGNYCSIQIESEEQNLWLGVDIDTLNQNSSRMLLTCKQVKELLPVLQRFADTGVLFKQNERK